MNENYTRTRPEDIPAA